MTQDRVQKIWDLAAPIVTEEGCELLDVEIANEMGSLVLRLFIDKEAGVEVGDCSRVSHSVEDLLEVEQVMKGRYHLEVSSPGLNRPLRKKEHFQKVLGKTVDVSTKEKINGRRRYKGILKEMRVNELVIELVIEIDTQDFSVPLGLIEKANLVLL